MSIASTTRLEQLEYRFELSRIAYAELLARIASLESQLANLQMGQYQSPGGGGGAIGFVSGGVVIAAGSTATADISIRSGGSTVTLVTGATIFNSYASATTSGKTLTVGKFADDTWLVLAQGC